MKTRYGFAEGEPLPPFETIAAADAYAAAEIAAGRPPDPVVMVGVPGSEVAMTWGGIRGYVADYNVDSWPTQIARSPQGSPEDLFFIKKNNMRPIIGDQNIISSAGKVSVLFSTSGGLIGDADSGALAHGVVKLNGVDGTYSNKSTTVATYLTPHLCNFCATADVVDHDTSGSTNTSFTYLRLVDPNASANHITVGINKKSSELFISGNGSLASAEVVVSKTVQAAYRLALAVVNDCVLAFCDSGSGWELLASNQMAIDSLSPLKFMVQLGYYSDGGCVSVGGLQIGYTGECALADMTLATYMDGSPIVDADGSRYLTMTSRFYSPSSVWIDQARASHAVIAKIDMYGDINIISHLFTKRASGKIGGDSPVTVVCDKASGMATILVPGFASADPPHPFYGTIHASKLFTDSCVIDVEQLSLFETDAGAWDFAVYADRSYIYVSYTTKNTISGYYYMVCLRGADFANLTEWKSVEFATGAIEGCKIAIIGGSPYWLIGRDSFTFIVYTIDCVFVCATTIPNFTTNAAIMHPCMFAIASNGYTRYRLITFGGTAFSGCSYVGYGIPILLDCDIEQI